MQAIADTINEETENQEALAKEFGWFKEQMGEFKFSLTKPYFDQREKTQAGTGGSLPLPSIHTPVRVVCSVWTSAMTTPPSRRRPRIRPQPQGRVGILARPADHTPKDFIRIDDIDEKIGALETMLLDKSVYQSMACGDGSCTGCGEKTILHIFTGTITALMQRRVKKHVEYLDGLIAKIEQHIKNKLAETVDISDLGAIQEAVERTRVATSSFPSSQASWTRARPVRRSTRNGWPGSATSSPS
jgi:pyruvate-ferredoxin/flavodoxin oxidoreductase